QLLLQALAVAVALRVGQRRALGVELHPLDLLPRQLAPPSPQTVLHPPRAQLAAIGLAALQVLAREFAVVFGKATLQVCDLPRVELVEQRRNLRRGGAQALPRVQ